MTGKKPDGNRRAVKVVIGVALVVLLGGLLIAVGVTSLIAFMRTRKSGAFLIFPPGTPNMSDEEMRQAYEDYKARRRREKWWRPW